jgi:hypothetical protein
MHQATHPIGYALTANGLFRLYKRLTSMEGVAVEMNQPQLIVTLRNKND